MSDSAPFDRVTWPVRTDRLTIRPVTIDDLARLYEIRALPGVSHWLTQAPSSYAEYLERNNNAVRLGQTLAIELGGVVVGDLYLAVEAPWSQLEAAPRAHGTLGVVGWCVDPAYAGRGLATEGATALLRICFDGLGVRRVVAGAFAANVASVRVMQKIGMRQESYGVRESLHRDLGWLDGVGYAILAEEWRVGR